MRLVIFHQGDKINDKDSGGKKGEKGQKTDSARAHELPQIPASSAERAADAHASAPKTRPRQRPLQPRKRKKEPASANSAVRISF